MNRNDPRFDLLEKIRSSPPTPEVVAQLENALRSDPDFRREYLRYINLEFHAPSALRSLQKHSPAPIPPTDLDPAFHAEKKTATRPSFFVQWRPLAAGILLGMASASWAFSQRSTNGIVQSVPLHNPDFENTSGPLPTTFPAGTGLWSGDPTEVTPTPLSDSLALRFLSPSSPAQNGTANSCDTYQWVDLRPYQSLLKNHPETDLELSALFLDSRPEAATPVRFTAYLFLFAGEPTQKELTKNRLQQETLSMGKKSWVSPGGQTSPRWTALTARCAFPAEANFALIQLSAGRDTKAGTPAPQLGQQWVDQVRLQLKLRP